MRRGFVIACAILLAAAAPALAAGPRKLAVVTTAQGNGSAFNEAIRATRNIENGSAIPNDEFNVEVRTWGQAGVDDSTWFRAHGYDAVLIPYLDGGSGGNPVGNGPWNSQWKDAAGNANIRNSPLSGRWGIPVFVCATTGITVSNVFNASTDYIDSTKYIAGIRYDVPAGTVPKPAVDSAGTWRFRSLCRLKGSQTDTIYSDPTAFGSRPNPWTGRGTVAALVWADSALRLDPDTSMSAWRWRPTSGPGIYYFLDNISTFNGDCVGLLEAFQYMATMTAIPVVRKRAIPLIRHDVEPGALTAQSKSLLSQQEAVLTKYNVGTSVATPVGSTEFASYDTQSLAIVRPAILAGRSRPMPFSYQTVSGTSWNWQYYASTDTGGAAIRFNRMLATMASADSFGFGKFSVPRLTGPGTKAGAYLAKVFKDAGVDLVETVDDVPSGAGWALQCSPSAHGDNQIFNIPGTGETRTIYVGSTRAFPHDVTFSALKGATADAEYVGSTWLDSFSAACQYPVGIYWHVNTTTNGGDPYYAFLLNVMLRQASFFDRVVEIDSNFRFQILNPRSNFNPRF